MTMLAFVPDTVDRDLREPNESALFLGVRGDPPLESTQLRWQARLSPAESVELESGNDLRQLGGALFVTTREPRPELEPGASPDPIGWLRWIAAQVDVLSKFS